MELRGSDALREWISMKVSPCVSFSFKYAYTEVDFYTCWRPAMYYVMHYYIDKTPDLADPSNILRMMKTILLL